MALVSGFARFVVAVILATGTAPPALAGPRDEVLRLTPSDSALVIVVQSARHHTQAVSGSPFAEWFPKSALGQCLSATAPLRQIQESAGPLFTAIGVTPEDLLNDVFGDAVVFAYTPAPPTDPNGERAILLIRPRKPETLEKLMDRVNDLQKDNGEIKAIVRRDRKGEPYFERQKSNGGTDYYCFRGGVFAFSGSEPDVLAVIDRDRTSPPIGDKPPELTARLLKLGVSDALAVLLLNPRALDAEVRAKVARAKDAEKPYLARFVEVWDALDVAAVYFTVGADVEAGVSLAFRPDSVPPAIRNWLTGVRSSAALWGSVPDNTLLAAVTRFRASELLDAVRSLLPEQGKKSLDTALRDALGPVVGRDRLASVLDALGPEWAVWMESPPADHGFLPVAVGVVQISTDGPKGKETSRVIVRAISYGFEAARVAYNTTHADQIEIQETQDGDVAITSLANVKCFPPEIRPSFAFKGGYLILASHPDAIKRFRPPSKDVASTEEAVVARLSGTGVRSYLQTHRLKLAKFLSESGHGNEKDLLKQIEQFTAALEPVDRVELVTRGNDSGVRLAVRVKLVKPLKK